MAVSLTKIVNGKPVISDTLLKEQVVKCAKCDQTYRFGYSDGESHRLSAWLKKAEDAVRKSHHAGEHQLPTVELH